MARSLPTWVGELLAREDLLRVQKLPGLSSWWNSRGRCTESRKAQDLVENEVPPGQESDERRVGRFRPPSVVCDEERKGVGPVLQAEG